MKSALFVDVSNLYTRISKKYEGRTLDYLKLIRLAGKFGDLNRAIAYGSQIRNEASNFIICLRKFGYEPRFKRHTMSEDGTKIIRKAGWDVDIAVDMLRHAKRLDTIILASSDSDLIPALNYVRHEGAKTIVVGCGISHEMRQSVDRWYEVDERLFEKQDNTEETESEVSFETDLETSVQE
jgi:uncharacterized LabA/DUF88 family protein